MCLKRIMKDSLSYHWQWYKHFFSLNYIRYFATWFAISPIVATATENIGGNNKFCIENTCLTYHLELPFSWWLLWVGSLLFITAFSLYHFYCPKFIKDYSSYADYESARHSPRWASWEALYLVQDATRAPRAYDLNKFVERLVNKKLAHPIGEKSDQPIVQVREDQSVLFFCYQEQNYELAMPKFQNSGDAKSIDDVATYELVWEIFGRRSTSYETVRKIIYILVNIAWAIVAISIIQNIYSATHLIFRQLF